MMDVYRTFLIMYSTISLRQRKILKPVNNMSWTLRSVWCLLRRRIYRHFSNRIVNTRPTETRGVKMKKIDVLYNTRKSISTVLFVVSTYLKILLLRCDVVDYVELPVSIWIFDTRYSIFNIVEGKGTVRVQRCRGVEFRKSVIKFNHIRSVE